MFNNKLNKEVDKSFDIGNCNIGLVVRASVSCAGGRSQPAADQNLLEMVVVAFPLGAQDYENSTTTGLPAAG